MISAHVVHISVALQSTQNVVMSQVSRMSLVPVPISSPMLAMNKWGLERRHLLLLFLAGMASRGVIKSLLGPTAAFALLLVVALYYLYMKRQSVSIYDEAARQQVKAAAKLDALHDLSGAKLSDAEKLATRQTHFQLSEEERMVITDRIHKYSSKMSGSHKDRKKFLAVSRRRRTEAEARALANGETITQERTPAPTSESKSDDASASTSRETALEKVVEDAVNATL